MIYYQIHNKDGLITQAISPAVCFSRLLAETDMNKEYIGNDGKSVSFTEENITKLLSNYPSLNLFKHEEDRPTLKIKSIEVEYLNDIGGIFADMPEEGDFKINDQTCTDYQVTKHWEFSVRTVVDGQVTGNAINVCSHQNMLDAYQHKGCWHVRWDHPTKDKYINFIFDFASL